METFPRSGDKRVSGVCRNVDQIAAAQDHRLVGDSECSCPLGYENNLRFRRVPMLGDFRALFEREQLERGARLGGGLWIHEPADTSRGETRPAVGADHRD